MTTDFEQMRELAYRAEMVASRRLAAKQSLSPEQALRQTLERVAGEAGLQRLLEIRQAQALADIARRAARQQGQCDAYNAKRNRNQLPAGAWLAWFDGSARPNPGRCGIGAVLQGPDGQQLEICQAGGYGNSSEAEYHALIALLELAVKLKAAPLVVYGDSRVVIDDVVRSADLAALSLGDWRARALALMAQLDEVRLCWIPRHKNSAADALSQRASLAPTDVQIDGPIDATINATINAPMPMDVPPHAVCTDGGEAN